MIITIHAVNAVYDIPTFDPSVSITKPQPLRYDCASCDFSGNLEQGVEHVVKNQFVVKESIEKSSHAST